MSLKAPKPIRREQIQIKALEISEKESKIKNQTNNKQEIKNGYELITLGNYITVRPKEKLELSQQRGKVNYFALAPMI